MLLVLLCGTFGYLVAANTTDSQLGVLGPSTGPARDDLLLGILRQMEKMGEDRAQDKQEQLLARAQDKQEQLLARAQDKQEQLLARLQDKQEQLLARAQDKQELLRAIGEVSDGHAQDKQELLRAIGEVSDAVVTAATSDRVYACARDSAVLLQTFLGKLNTSMHCSAFPLFSTQSQVSSTIFLTSAHCFGDIERAGADFASTTLLFFRSLSFSCTLGHHFICHPSASAACTAAAPSMDLAIVRCAIPVPVPSTRLSALPLQHFQRAFLYGYSDGLHLDPDLEFHYQHLQRSSVLHLKLARLSPSIQYPLGLTLINTTTVQLLSAAPSSTGASGEGAKLPLASYQGFLDTVPEQGMSGGAVVDSQCGLLGVIQSRSVFGEGGVFVRLSPSVVQRIMAVLGKL
jgi:hypothetical protein